MTSEQLSFRAVSRSRGCPSSRVWRLLHETLLTVPRGKLSFFGSCETHALGFSSPSDFWGSLFTATP